MFVSAPPRPPSPPRKAGPNRDTTARLTNFLPEKGNLLPSHCILTLQESSYSSSMDAYRPDLNKRTDHPSETATVSLTGPFRVTSANGVDITPGSALRQAILAVLVTAPGQIRSRKTLQDMFWGAADQARAAASLRTAIYLLRQDLSALGDSVLRADRHTVSLAPGRLTAQKTHAFDTGFLEGIDLPLSDCEGFEDWLRAMRGTDDADAEKQTAPLSPVRVCSPPSVIAHKSPLALGVLPSMSSVRTPQAAARAEAVIDGVAQFFSQMTYLDVHDLRCSDTRATPLPLASGLGATHWLQAVIDDTDRGTRVCLRLMEAVSRKILWLSPPITVGGPDDLASAWTLGETIADRMLAHPAAADAPNLYPLTVITALFSLDAALVAQTEGHLDRLIADGGAPVLQCLRLFTQVFKENEAFGTAIDPDVTGLCDLLSRIPASDPHLPLCESLVGYSVHMLLGENDLADHLVENAFRRAPNLALNLDHLAVLRMVRGDLDGAEAAFRKCLAASALSPLRYTYEVTGAMIYLGRGDLKRSLHHANQAMFRKPRYLAALRYSMAGFALSDRPQDARRMLTRIQSLRPGYDLSAWAEGYVRRSAPDLGQKMVQSLRQSALL